MKKIVFGIILLIILGVAGFLLLRGNGGGGPVYRTEPLTRGSIQETVNASGTINPVTTVQVGTQVSGRVLELYADFNSRVTKGQVIARIDPAQCLAQEEQAVANRLAAQANVEKAEAQVHDAEIKLRRARELLSQNLLSQDEFDSAQVAWDTARASVSGSRAQLVQAEASLKLARTNLGYTTIVSPVDGMVVSRTVDVGQTVAASFQTPTLFSIAQDLTRMQISASVDEADIGQVAEGQEVVFTVDAYPDREFKGEVTQVRNAPVVVQNVVTYDVIIAVDNADLKLKPGMTASTSIIVNRADGVLKIPNAALRVKVGPPGGGKRGPVGAARSEKPRGPVVWVLERGKPAPVSIRPGISDGSFTALAEGELAEGREVIVEVTGLAAERPRNGSPITAGRH